ncbi:MAG: sodium/solute symporter [Bacteroidetes bacterium]|nr:sodium/solute symporter [Bacteroidota bacterium]
MKNLHTADVIVFLIYLAAVAGYGYYIHRRRQGGGSKEFFLAEGSLTWWAIGASIIASNISAEHFIGMSGSGFALGLAIASYEWMAAAALIVVAVVFIPLYRENGIYTMPQFLAKRYNNHVSTIMAVWWLLIYVFVNLTSIIYLGALAIHSVTGISFIVCIAGLVIFSILVTLGGMNVIGYTDVVQVLVLIIGGLVTTYLALVLVSVSFGYESNVLTGLRLIGEKADSHLHMIFSSDHPYYNDLPGLSVIIGGMWINNLNYFGCNQYITQRALGADIKTARKGLLFAAYLKLFIPVIAVVPGIAVWVLYQNGAFHSEMLDAAGVVKPDHAYPTLLSLLPPGMKGLAFAALTAAIVASLAGKANSISTIFALDIYKKYLNKEASEKNLVFTGRWTVVVSLGLAALVAPALQNLDQAYQFVQEYVGFISPGVLGIFLLGFFWKRTTSAAALMAALLTVPLSAFLKFLPSWSGGWFPDLPFMDRMTLTFFILIVLMIFMSLTSPASSIQQDRLLKIERSYFKVGMQFVISSLVILGILVAIYAAFW